MTTLNKPAYVYDMPKGMAAVRAHQQFMTDNKHLALQFPIPELRYYFHPSYPKRQSRRRAIMGKAYSLIIGRTRQRRNCSTVAGAG